MEKIHKAGQEPENIEAGLNPMIKQDFQAARPFGRQLPSLWDFVEPVATGGSVYLTAWHGACVVATYLAAVSAVLGLLLGGAAGGALGSFLAPFTLGLSAPAGPLRRAPAFPQ